MHAFELTGPSRKYRGFLYCLSHSFAAWQYPEDGPAMNITNENIHNTREAACRMHGAALTTRHPPADGRHPSTRTSHNVDPRPFQLTWHASQSALAIHESTPTLLWGQYTHGLPAIRGHHGEIINGSTGPAGTGTTRISLCCSWPTITSIIFTHSEVTDPEACDHDTFPLRKRCHSGSRHSAFEADVCPAFLGTVARSQRDLHSSSQACLHKMYAFAAPSQRAASSR
jgi:hypothetical protein